MESDISTKHQTENTGDMPAEEFRKFGYQLIDWIAEYMSTVQSMPVLPDEPGNM